MNTNIVLEPEVKIPFFVLLHQLGWDENELLYLKDILPKNSFILAIKGPRKWTPEREDGRGWFDILGCHLENFSKEDDIEMCSDYIKTIIDETREKYLLLDDPIFIGVSQGATVALHSCIENKIKCKGVVSLLGYYEFKLDSNQLNDTPILMINGRTDFIIPNDWAEKSHLHLKTKNNNITTIFLNSGHEMTEELINISKIWIHNLLQ